MLNSASKKLQPQHEAPADSGRQRGSVPGDPTRRFGPREQQSLLEMTYDAPEPVSGEYSGIAKVAILATGCAASWGLVLAVVRFAGGH